MLPGIPARARMHTRTCALQPNAPSLTPPLHPLVPQGCSSSSSRRAGTRTSKAWETCDASLSDARWLPNLEWGPSEGLRPPAATSGDCAAAEAPLPSQPRGVDVLLPQEGRLLCDECFPGGSRPAALLTSCCPPHALLLQVLKARGTPGRV